MGLARALVDAARLDEAGAEVRRALALQPESPDALAASASLLAAQGQLDAARLAFAHALERRPEADDVRLDYAGILAKLGRSSEARGEYERLARGSETPDAIRRAARERLR